MQVHRRPDGAVDMTEEEAALHPTPCTPHTTLCTLHPTPHTLHLTPYTLSPNPSALNLKPGAQAARWPPLLSCPHALSLSLSHTHTRTHTHTHEHKYSQAAPALAAAGTPMLLTHMGEVMGTTEEEALSPVLRGEKMALRGTDPESYITEYTLVYED